MVLRFRTNTVISNGIVVQSDTGNSLFTLAFTTGVLSDAYENQLFKGTLIALIPRELLQPDHLMIMGRALAPYTGSYELTVDGTQQEVAGTMEVSVEAIIGCAIHLA